MTHEPNAPASEPASEPQPQTGSAVAIWTSAPDDEHPPAVPLSLRARTLPFLPYALVLGVALVAGFGGATFATAPALTDAVDEVAAIDARGMGLAADLDPTGQQKKSAALGRDLGALKGEIARLQRALDQARTAQSAQSKAVAGQAASSQDEVKSLKGEIASLQKMLEAAREASSAKIDQLSAKLDASKDGEARLAEMRARLDRIEKTAVDSPKPGADAGPVTTGSVARREPERVVRNWVVREVFDGVALLDGRFGSVEVVRGGRAPGLGRVRSIERRDRQWVVVTDKGVVLQR
ncbi:hypothetical protein [Hansschlegelia sp. KR7-227]|uniref:hypothetical protein n=1 Tax=Hansschlegelia sp. KR7-227 TaxID=3400914 RepID=UPI003C043476